MQLHLRWRGEHIMAETKKTTKTPVESKKSTDMKVQTKTPAKTVTKAPTEKKPVKTPVTKTPKEKKPKVEKVNVMKQWVRGKTPFENYNDAKAAQKASKESGKPARIVRVVTFFIEAKVPVKEPKATIN
jgi:hypothetical protein